MMLPAYMSIEHTRIQTIRPTSTWHEPKEKSVGKPNETFTFLFALPYTLFFYFYSSMLRTIYEYENYFCNNIHIINKYCWWWRWFWVQTHNKLRTVARTTLKKKKNGTISRVLMKNYRDFAKRERQNLNHINTKKIIMDFKLDFYETYKYE